MERVATGAEPGRRLRNAARMQPASIKHRIRCSMRNLMAELSLNPLAELSPLGDEGVGLQKTTIRDAT